MRYGRLVRHLLLAVLLGAVSSVISAQDKITVNAASAVDRNEMEARLELLDTVNRMVEFRHLANPHGYEKDSGFTAGFYLHKERLERALAADGPTAPPTGRMLQIVAQAVQDYERNREDFLAFHFDMKRRSSRLGEEELARMEPQHLLGSLLAFTLLVEARDPELADVLKKGSYMWPFCMTQNSTSEKPDPEVKRKLLVQLAELQKRGFSIPFMVELASRTKFSEPLSADDLEVWQRAGIPDAVIRAALESSRVGGRN